MKLKIFIGTLTLLAASQAIANVALWNRYSVSEDLSMQKWPHVAYLIQNNKGNVEVVFAYSDNGDICKVGDNGDTWITVSLVNNTKVKMKHTCDDSDGWPVKTKAVTKKGMDFIIKEMKKKPYIKVDAQTYPTEQFATSYDLQGDIL